MLSEIAYKVVGCFFENKLNLYIKFARARIFLALFLQSPCGSQNLDLYLHKQKHKSDAYNI